MSGASGATIGLMEGAYFVGRKEIVDFINTTLELHITKVEDTASGAIACQLLDIMYPNVVPMQKVDWSAKKDFEFLSNYKILQTSFTKLRIDRHIDVDRLITAKYMDNLEFMQWFKRYFELQVADKGDYDCRGRRALGKGAPAGSAGASPATLTSTKANGVAGSVAAKPPATGAVRATKTVAGANVPKATALKPASAPTKKSSSLSTLPPSSQSSGSAGGPGAAEAAVRQIATLTKQVEDAVHSGNELRTEMEGLEKERDFYFEKLRDIEIMLQEIEDSGKGTDLTASIFKILYKTQEGFEQAPDFNHVAENAPVNLVAEDLTTEASVLEGY